MIRNSLRAGALLLVLLAMSQLSAFAHKVNVFAWVEGDVVKVRANFGKRSRPARNCPVRVYGPDGELLLELRTDEKGECSFRPPRIVDLRIDVDAGEGHKKSFTLSVEDLAGLKPAAAAAGSKASGEFAVRPAAVQRELAGIRRELASMRAALTAMQRRLARIEEPRGVAMQDVINGLCAILGVTGGVTLTLYAVRRRRGGAA